MTPEDWARQWAQQRLNEHFAYMAGAMQNARPQTTMEAKVAAARAWLAQREAERGPHKYSSVPTVLLPVAQRRIAREKQERRT